MCKPAALNRIDALVLASLREPNRERLCPASLGNCLLRSSGNGDWRRKTHVLRRQRQRGFALFEPQGVAEARHRRFEFALAFELVADVARRATFPADELELARTRYLSNLAAQLAQPEVIAERFFAKEIYGSHPYGRRTSEASYKAVTRDDVKAFAAARLKPTGALLVVAGDVTLDQIRALATKHFAGWTGAGAGSSFSGGRGGFPASAAVPIPVSTFTERPSAASSPSPPNIMSCAPPEPVLRVRACAAVPGATRVRALAWPRMTSMSGGSASSAARASTSAWPSTTSSDWWDAPSSFWPTSPVSIPGPKWRSSTTSGARPVRIGCE